MAVMVAGGSGFIGSHLVRGLVDLGEKVVVFDAAPNMALLEDVRAKIEIVKGDATQMVDILQAIQHYGIEEVYHLIALLADVCQQKPHLALKVNVKTLVNFLEAARLTKLKKIIFASSVAVYHSTEPPPVKEDAPLNPGSVYGATKVLGEFFGLHYQKNFGVDFRALRFTTIYGLGKFGGSTGICSLMIEKSAHGEAVRGDILEAETDWLYIKDAVHSLILAQKIESPKHRIYNIGGGSYSVAQVIRAVKNILPQADIEMEAKRRFPWPPAYSWERAQQELGYQPLYDLEEGIKDFIKEARNKSL